jgi:hypothetical protein
MCIAWFERRGSGEERSRGVAFGPRGLALGCECRSAMASIRQWADLSSPTRPPENPADWEAVGQIMDSARRLLVLDEEKLRGLLAESTRKLDGLADPFETDLGVHRWLNTAREEAYSDWLDWIVRQIQMPDLVFQLFQIPLPSHHPEWEHMIPTVEREFVVPGGRLDLVIRYPGRALLVIEVKTNPPGIPALAKQEPYLRWLHQEKREPIRVPILLVVEAPENSHGFDVRLWRDCCQALRHLIPALRNRRGTTVAAMALAFAGAVEQNLLELPAQPLESLAAGRLMNLGGLFDYLEGT